MSNYSRRRDISCLDLIPAPNPGSLCVCVKQVCLPAERRAHRREGCVCVCEAGKMMGGGAR